VKCVTVHDLKVPDAAAGISLASSDGCTVGQSEFTVADFDPAGGTGAINVRTYVADDNTTQSRDNVIRNNTIRRCHNHSYALQDIRDDPVPSYIIDEHRSGVILPGANNASCIRRNAVGTSGSTVAVNGHVSRGRGLRTCLGTCLYPQRALSYRFGESDEQATARHIRGRAGRRKSPHPESLPGAGEKKSRRRMKRRRLEANFVQSHAGGIPVAALHCHHLTAP
jgi:hypothetical protein